MAEHIERQMTRRDWQALRALLRMADAVCNLGVDCLGKDLQDRIIFPHHEPEDEGELPKLPEGHSLLGGLSQCKRPVNSLLRDSRDA